MRSILLLALTFALAAGCASIPPVVKPNGTSGFNTVPEALGFIVDCVENNDSTRLISACVGRGDQPPLIIKQPNAFKSLVCFHESKSLTKSYGEKSFPEKGLLFKLGGHGHQFQHLHIDFVKKGQRWYLADVWNCR